VPAPPDELKELIKETKDLSAYIATLKRRRNRATDEIEKTRLTEEIKMRQFQALFYMEKMDNLNQQSNRKS